MSEVGNALKSADTLLEELKGGPAARPASLAPTMGNLKRCSYTHDAMIDLIIKHPELDQNEIAAHFGYTPGWISNILASDAFQAKMALRREEVIDPVLKATIEERFKALVHQSLTVLMHKLSQPAVSDTVALRAAELGAKALGVGGHAPTPPAPKADRLQILAERLVILQANVKGRTLDGEVESVQLGPVQQQA